jgi:transposase
MEASFAGVDWASEKHDVVVQNATGEVLLAASFAHDEAGLRSLCGQLVRLNVRLVAIERPDGVLVERLLDAGLRVLALHPNQVAAARARIPVSGGKSDRFDAFVLCELARTDHHRFRVLEPDSDQTKALRALCRGREDLVQARVALSNQLRAELERFWPGAVKIFRSLDSPTALASWRSIRARSKPERWASSAWPRSCAVSTTAAARPKLRVNSGWREAEIPFGCWDRGLFQGLQM